MKTALLRRLSLVSVLLLLLGALTLLPQHAAQAASFVSQHAAQPTASCSGDGCDGLDPMQTGCADDAYTTQFVYIYDDNGNQMGSAQLRFSPSCSTNWTTVTSYIGTTYIQADVQRSYDSLTEYGYGENTVVWSPMVYSPGPAYGLGCVWTLDGGANYCASTPYA